LHRKYYHRIDLRYISNAKIIDLTLPIYATRRGQDLKNMGSKKHRRSRSRSSSQERSRRHVRSPEHSQSRNRSPVKGSRRRRRSDSGGSRSSGGSAGPSRHRGRESGHSSESDRDHRDRRTRSHGRSKDRDR